VSEKKLARQRNFASETGETKLKNQLKMPTAFHFRTSSIHSGLTPTRGLAKQKRPIQFESAVL